MKTKVLKKYPIQVPDHNGAACADELPDRQYSGIRRYAYTGSVVCSHIQRVGRGISVQILFL